VRAGVAPVPLTPAHPGDAVASILAICDGLLLTGGDDVHPARYGMRPSPQLGAVSLERDALEWRALEIALTRGMPVLGICRGLQVLNVFLGGTLYQDLASELPGAHGQSRGWGDAAHAVSVVEGSRLRRIIGAATLHSNSYHHQAVRALAPGLHAVAHAEDGVIEAVETPEPGWVVAVQWHPERGAADAPADDPDRRLFAAFGAAVAEHAA
jgi:putative glutamine amidotransferase